MKPLTECRLYTFIDTAYLHGRSPQELARQLCDGGSDLIQLRAKQSCLDEIRTLAAAILRITSRAGVWLVINDYPTIATEVGAHFCHLGQEDFFRAGRTHVSEVKSSDPRLQIGLSTHDPVQAESAVAAGADYVAVGPVYPTGTKPSAKAVTLDYVRWAAANVRIPWFAIGGITLRNVDDVTAAGATRICVVSAILTAPDVVQACQQFKDRLLSARF